MPQLTEWLKLMISEIARKREDAERASDEDAKRQSEQGAAPAERQMPLKKSG
ncbi:MAG: hypothetical protein ABI885_23195 [Gammaproteobacteria bacterium]